MARVLPRYVLVVEDDPTLRELYRSVIRYEGYAVKAVEDGIDALRRVDVEPPDAVVLDLGLPRLSGRDVQRELRARSETRHIPIVVVSGTDTSDLDRTQFVSVLKKPVTTDALLSAIRKCFRRRRPESN